MADENIKRIDSELHTSYFTYAKAVIEDRGLPDFRDGFKKVQRRIIFSMFSHKIEKFKKCANITGAVMGELHPHGDSSIYQALVRLTQPFSTNLPLIDGQGNFGSIDGDPAAAMRYTEARLSKYSYEFTKDFNKETSNMIPNYDGTIMEPVFLPTRVPNLLINGTYGIAVGVSTSIPPHNISEVIDALLATLKNPEITLDEIMEYIKGPDFPLGSIISSPESIRNAYLTGEGSVTIRSSYVFENDNIIFTDIPYMVQKSDIMKSVAENISSGKITGISTIRDESDGEGIRMVFRVKNGYSKEIVINQLYSSTSLKTSFRICLFALDENGKPKIYTLKEYLKQFLKFRYQVIVNRLQHDLIKWIKRMHILIGLFVALDNMDDIINGIKKSENLEEAKLFLQNKGWKCGSVVNYLKSLGVEFNDSSYNFSNEQIKGILELRLNNLVRLEKDSISNELGNLHKSIEHANFVLGSEIEIKKIIEEELTEIKNKYIYSRKSIIEGIFVKFQQRDLITPEDMMIILNNENYIKRVNLDLYKTQHKGGKGRIASDNIFLNVIGNTHDMILFFTTNGFVFSMYVYEIPEGDMYSKGRALINLLENNVVITTFLIISEEQIKNASELSIIFVTKDGHVRKNGLSQFINLRANGKKYMNEEDCKNIVSVLIAGETDKLFMATKFGLGVLINVNEFRTFDSRNSDGVIGCRLKSNDILVNAILIHNEQDLILTVSDKGYGKISNSEDYRLIHRGGNGVINFKSSPKTGCVIDILNIKMDDEVILMTNQGIAIRFSLADMRINGRNTAGVRLCRLEGNNLVASVKKV
jgi:DNA gyrase subunit A